MREYYVYKHTNKINGKCYIGQTCNIVKRWKSYSYKYCTKFYDAIKKYGWDNFTHEVLKVCAKDDVDFYEAYYIKFYNSIENGYNLESGGQTNKTHSKETIEKITQKNIGRKCKEETKEKISKSLIGKPLSQERRKNMSIAHKGKKLKPFTEKHLLNMKQSAMKRAKNVICLNNGEIYNSIEEAGKRYNLYPESISRVCKGKQKTAGGYKWEFINDTVK